MSTLSKDGGSLGLGVNRFNVYAIHGLSSAHQILEVSSSVLEIKP
jgi:hypothetical protein